MDQSSEGIQAASPNGPTTDAVTHDLDADEVAVDIEILSTLGNRTRYEALRLLTAASSPVCVCELEPSLGVTQGAVSQALSRLHDAGLVERRKSGRWRYYSPTPAAERLLGTLDGVRRGD